MKKKDNSLCIKYVVLPDKATIVISFLHYFAPHLSLSLSPFLFHLHKSNRWYDENMISWDAKANLSNTNDIMMSIYDNLSHH